MPDELLLIIVAFVAYAAYSFLYKKGPAATSPATDAVPEGKLAAAKRARPKPPAKPEAAPGATVAPAEVAVAPEALAPLSKAITATPAIAKKGLKDPKTGDVATSYSNYRFTKRWVKEALVAEKLLDKVYKNDELTPEIEAGIKTAIAKLEEKKKYKP